MEIEGKRYLNWDVDRKHPFVFNKYHVNIEDRTLSHMNSLYTDYNCTERDIAPCKGRIICNTIEEINHAIDNPPYKGVRHFQILSPLSVGKNDFKI